MKDEQEQKLNAFTIVLPSSPKGKLISVLSLLAILLNLWPIGTWFFNRNVLVFGLPLIVVWGVGLMVSIMVILMVARKWGVH